VLTGLSSRIGDASWRDVKFTSNSAMSADGSGMSSAVMKVRDGTCASKMQRCNIHLKTNVHGGANQKDVVA
jgi:hypothetical protein